MSEEKIFDDIVDRLRKRHLAVIQESFIHYAIFFVKGKIMSIGECYKIKHPNKYSYHAEHTGLRNFIKFNSYKNILNKNDKINILVLRFTKSGILSNSRPCENCILRLLKCKLNINKIYYSDNNKNIICEKLNKMYDNPITKLSSGFRKNENY